MATSPIQGIAVTEQGPMPVASGGTNIVGEDITADGKRSLPKGAHVRFSHVEAVDGLQAATEGKYLAKVRDI